MKAVINITEILSPDLKSRTSVSDLYLYIKNSCEKEIAIDFKDVKFATRSFIDEFYNVIIETQNPLFSIELINVPDDINLIINAVSKTQSKKNAISNNGTVVKFDNVDETSKFLQSLML